MNESQKAQEYLQQRGYKVLSNDGSTIVARVAFIYREGDSVAVCEDDLPVSATLVGVIEFVDLFGQEGEQ